MSKKVILSSLLASAAFLGASGTADAAKSSIKEESKMITIKTPGRLYKDSNLKQSTKLKKGVVYKVDGYRIINNKHFYRVYQANKNNKLEYRGYILNKDTIDLKATKVSKKIKTKKNMILWKNLYLTSQVTKFKEEKVYQVKYKYTLADGRNYYSLYYTDKSGKEKWAGYINMVNTIDFKPVSSSQWVTAVKDSQAYKNFYFTKKGTNFLSPKYNNNFKVERYYTLNGKRYYSVYRPDKNGKNVWHGYIESSTLKNLQPKSISKVDEGVIVKKDSVTYKDHVFNKKTSIKKGDKVYVHRYYTYGSGKHHASIFTKPSDSKDAKWLGYVNPSVLSHSQYEDIQESVQKANQAIKEAETFLKHVQASDKEKEALQNAIKTAKETVKDQTVGNVSNIKEIPSKLEAAMKEIELNDTSMNKELIMQLQAAIDLLKDVEKIGAEHLENDNQYDTVLKSAEDVLKAAQEGKAKENQIQSAIKLVENYLADLRLNTTELSKLIKEVKDSGSKVYMTKEQEEQFNKFIEKAEKAVEDKELSNTEKLKEVSEQAQKAKTFIIGQPTEKDVKELMEALKEETEIQDGVKHYAKDLFEGWNNVESKAKEAKEMMDEIKKDQSSTQNTASKAYTAKDVQTTTGELKQALGALTVNKENATKFYKAAEKAVGEDSAAKSALEKFKTQLESDHTLNNYQAIVQTAKTLVSAIEKSQTTITTDEATLKDGAKLSQVILSSDKSSEEAKELAKVVKEAAYEVDKNSTADASKSHAGLENNRAWTEFGGQGEGSYYDVIKDLQDYARQTTSVSDKELEKDTAALVDNMEGLRVLTDQLEAAMKSAEKQKADGDLIQEAKVIVESKTDSRRGLDNWKHIDELTLKLKKATVEAEKNNTITTDEATLKDGAKLSQAILSSDKSSEEAKELAKVVEVAYKVDKNSTGDHQKSIAGLENNRAWTEFGGQGNGSYYDAMKDLQDYARNTTSVKANQLNSDKVELIDDMENLRVLTNQLKAAMESAEKQKADEQLIQEAKVIVESKTDSRRGLDNWKHINELTKQLKESTVEAEKNNTITTDEATLKDGAKLSRTILTSSKSSSEAKELAKVVKAAYEVDKNSTGDHQKSIAGLENNRAWTEFGGQGNGSYYDAMKDLQDYARNTASVEMKELSKDKSDLTQDMDQLVVLTNQLQDALNESEKVENEVSVSNELSSLEQAQNEAQTIIKSKQTGIENWKKINKLTEQLKAATQKLKTLINK